MHTKNKNNPQKCLYNSHVSTYFCIFWQTEELEESDQIFWTYLNSSTCSNTSWYHLVFLSTWLFIIKVNTLEIQTQNLNMHIYNMTEVIIQTLYIFFPHNWLNKLKIRSLNTVWWTRKVAGSATCKQSKTVWNCIVLSGQFVYLVCSEILWLQFCPKNCILHL